MNVELKPLTIGQEVAVLRYLEFSMVNSLFIHKDGIIPLVFLARSGLIERELKVWSLQTLGFDPDNQTVEVTYEGLLITDLHSQSAKRIHPKDIRFVDPTPRTGVYQVGESGILSRAPRKSAYDASLGTIDPSIIVPEEYRGRQLLVKWFLASPNIRARCIDAAVIDPESFTLVERIIERK